MIISKVYKLKPTGIQEKSFLQSFGNCRWVYNRSLNRKTTIYKETGANISLFALMKELTSVKKENDRLSLSCAQSLQHSITNMETAFKRFYKGSGFPRWKSRRSRQSFHIPQGIKVDYEWNGVSIPKVGWVKFFKDMKPIDGDIKNATISKSASGYYISIVYDKKEEERNIPDTDIGIDMGLKDFIVTSEGEKVKPPKPFLQSQRSLRRLQRHLSRQIKGGNRWIKTRIQISRLHEHIANQRKDFLHKLSTSIAKRYGTCYIENLNVAGMMKNRRLSKSIGDAGWGIFGTLLSYKTNVVEIGRFEPSSKLCSECGNLYGELKLSQREWTCEKCLYNHDRDINASKNILYLGRKVLKE